MMSMSMKRTFLAQHIFLIVIAAALNTNLLAQEALSQILERVHAAHGGRWRTGEIADWRCQGTITHFAVDGSRQTFDITLLRKGREKIQTIVKQPAGELRLGSDGIRTWHAIGAFSSVAHGEVLDFIETNTTRSVQTLFNYQTVALTLSDLGTRVRGLGIGPGRTVRVVQAEDNRGRKTRYLVDQASSMIIGLEIEIGRRRSAFGGDLVSVTEVYAFSDFRHVQGVNTPFKIERFRSGMKVQEIRIVTVSYNVGIVDSSFKP
jgi:hypothetical protein